MRKNIVIITCVLLGLAILMAAGSITAQTTGEKSTSLEQLIKGTDFEYTRLPEGDFRILVNIDGEITIVIASEANVSNQADTKLAYLFTPVLIMPKDYKPSASMLRKIAETNDTLLVGKLSLNDNVILYNSSCWMKGADSTTMLYELVLAHKNRQELKKTFQRFLEE